VRTTGPRNGLKPLHGNTMILANTFKKQSYLAHYSFGMIYVPHTLEPLKQLGINAHKLYNLLSSPTFIPIGTLTNLLAIGVLSKFELACKNSSNHCLDQGAASYPPDPQ